jgi:anaerobic selenocysteine-containing dehydrogenase
MLGATKETAEMSARTRHPSLCRFCHVGCPITVELEGGRPVRVTGNRQSPTFRGFCCRRGQALPEHLTHPDRLLHSLKRMPDGTHQRISVETAMDEVAERISAIVKAHGPRAVALYIGTYTGPYPATGAVAGCWATMLGTPMIFTSATIDQPGKDVANAMLGQWLAGPQAFDESDVWMLVGGNPIVTLAGGIPSQNPARRLKDRLHAGMKFIVVDPRRTETARRAQVHLQIRPGEDAALLAAMLHVIFEEDLVDRDFVAENVSGVEALRVAVAPFTPERAAERADVPAAQIVEAARVFGRARRGLAVGLTGANMSGHSSLVEYLMLCLNTVCGRFLRAGESVANPGVLLPPATPRAQAVGPRPYRDLGEKMRVRNLGQNASGMPTAALADEILLEGEGQVRVLLSTGGNPIAAWPDQARTAAALEKLELLVQLDIKMSATAQMADYVIAPKISFEVPGLSYAAESIESFSVHWGYAEPFGMYAPRLIEPPEGSELIEDWEFFYGLAQRMGVPLFVTGVASTSATARAPRGVHPLDMENKPTTDELYERLTHGSRVSLEEVKRHPNGARFDADIRAEAKEPGSDERLDVGNPDMLSELGGVLAELPVALREGDTRPFLLVSRRLAHVYNSSGRDLALLKPRRGTYNPAYMHPADLEVLGVSPGDDVELCSRHGSIPAIVQPDPTLRRGLVSMAHAFGGVPGRGPDPRREGSNTSLLTSVEEDFDAVSGMPRMSGVPVAVRR